jgi:predicted deacetylase
LHNRHARAGKKRTALVSVHDLTPDRLPAVQETLHVLNTRNVHCVTLLVVPGSRWDDAGIAVLGKLQESGYELAGHGWTHRTEHIRGWKHWLHSRLISRNVAEHLSLDDDGIGRLIERCYQWFEDNRLQPPTLYVPPAWAMGAIRRAELRNLSFRQFEYFSGVYDAATDRFQRLALLGYEADTQWRVPWLRLWNTSNLALSRRTGVLRIAIHPFDLKLKLARDVIAHLGHDLEFRTYQSLQTAGT